MTVIGKNFSGGYGDVIQKTWRAVYGDVPRIGKVFRSLCGSVPLRGKIFKSRYDQARQIGRSFRGIYLSSGPVGKIFTGLYREQHGIVGKIFKSLYLSRSNSPIGKIFRGVYDCYAAGFLSTGFNLDIFAGGLVVESWSNFALGTDESRYLWEADLTIHSEEDSVLLSLYTPVEVYRYGHVYDMVVVNNARTAAVDDDSYEDVWSVKLASPAYMLSAAAAVKMTQTWDRGTTAKTIVQEICDNHGITLDWQHEDYPLAEIVADNQAPVEIIRTILNVTGALMQSLPGGALQVRKEIPTMPGPGVSPDKTMMGLHVSSTSEQSGDPVLVYNSVLVSDEAEGAASSVSLLHEEVEKTFWSKDVKAWAEPWSDFSLRVNAPSSEAYLVFEGETEEEKTEWLEFVNGESNSSKPVFKDFELLEFRGENPGDINWEKDKKTLTTAGDNEYYCQVRYKWRYRAYTYHSLSGKDYQLVQEHD